MSYDLFFYKRKESQLTEQAFADYLTQKLPFNNSEIYKQWDYENPETGVYFIIDWNEPNTDPEDIVIWDSFDEFEYLNFSFSINFFRPTYFGYEIFPIIETIVDELDLYILNSQEFDEVEMPKKFEKGYLEKQWITDNNRVSADHYENVTLNYMPLEKSNALWMFQFHRAALEKSLVEDIFVPGFFILKNDKDGQLYTACVWPNHIPIILPKVDYIIIKKVYKKLFRDVEESGFVAYDTVMKILGAYFEDFGYVIPHLKILKQNKADQMADKFNSLKIISSVTGFGPRVSLDNFVNVRQE